MTFTGWVPIVAPIAAASLTAMVAHVHFVKAHDDVAKWQKISLQLEIAQQLDDLDPRRSLIAEYVAISLPALIASQTRTAFWRFLVPYTISGVLLIFGAVIGVVASLEASRLAGKGAVALIALGMVGVVASTFVRVHRWAPRGSAAGKFNGQVRKLHARANALYPIDGPEIHSSLGSDVFHSVLGHKNVSEQ